MNAVLSGQGLKSFARALRHLARVGNEFYFEAKQEALILRVVNNGSTCFLSISFSDVFFINYQTTEDYEGSHCRVSARPLLMILRNIKNVMNCRLRLDPRKERLFIDIQKPMGISSQHVITILEYENLENFESPTDDVSTLVCNPTMLSRFLNPLPKNLRELGFDIGADRIEIRNHIDHPEKDVQTIRLNFPLDAADFITYDVKFDTRLIIPSHPFLSMVELAEISGDKLKIVFTQNGMPMIISINSNSLVKAKMVIATMQEDTLRTLRKHNGVSSYKELMGSYIESRVGSHGFEEPSEKISISSSEMEGNFSPLIDTFATGPSKLLSKKTNKAKRKSQDSNDGIAGNTSTNASSNVEQSKKQRIEDDGLTDEDREASQMLADEMDKEEFPAESFDTTLTPKQSLLDGLSHMKINLNMQLSSAVRGSESEQLPGSVRFDQSKCNYPSQDTPSLPRNLSTSHRSYSEPKRRKSDDSTKKLREKHFAKLSYKAVLNVRNISNGNTLVENSDTSDEENIIDD